MLQRCSQSLRLIPSFSSRQRMNSYCLMSSFRNACRNSRWGVLKFGRKFLVGYWGFLVAFPFPPFFFFVWVWDAESSVSGRLYFLEIFLVFLKEPFLWDEVSELSRQVSSSVLLVPTDSSSDSINQSSTYGFFQNTYSPMGGSDLTLIKGVRKRHSYCSSKSILWLSNSIRDWVYSLDITTILLQSSQESLGINKKAGFEVCTYFFIGLKCWPRNGGAVTQVFLVFVCLNWLFQFVGWQLFVAFLMPLPSPYHPNASVVCEQKMGTG